MQFQALGLRTTLVVLGMVFAATIGILIQGGRDADADDSLVASDHESYFYNEAATVSWSFEGSSGDQIALIPAGGGGYASRLISFEASQERAKSVAMPAREGLYHWIVYRKKGEQWKE